MSRTRLTSRSKLDLLEKLKFMTGHTIIVLSSNNDSTRIEVEEMTGSTVNGNGSIAKLADGVESLSLDTSKLHPLSPEVISRQATINIGTIGHVAHGKSTVVKAISGVQTVRFKNELVRNITIKLGYANAKVSVVL